MSTERRGTNLESSPSRRLSEAGLASRVEHRPSRGTLRSCVEVMYEMIFLTEKLHVLHYASSGGNPTRGVATGVDVESLEPGEWCVC